MSLTPSHNIAKAFNRAAKHYDNHAQLQHSSTQLVLNSIQPYIAPNIHILDLGSGTGTLAKLLSTQPGRPHYHLYQLDIAYNMCRRSHLYGSAIQGSIEYLPFAPSSMNIITSSMTLQWVNSLTSVFSAINTLLAPGGFFSCTIVGNGSLRELIHSFNKLGIVTPPVNSFPTLNAINLALHTAKITSARTQLWQSEELFDDVLTLLKYFKMIGANTLIENNKSALTKARISQLDFYYRENFQRPNGQIPITWQIYKVQWEKLV